MGIKLDRGATSALLVCAGSLLASGAFAQARVTEEDYARAERMLSANTVPLVDHAISGVKWLDDTHFLYVDNDAKGVRVMRMDAATGQATIAFDQPRMAKALAGVSGKQVDAKRLDKTISAVELADKGRYDIAVKGTHYLCEIEKPHCVAKPVHEG